MWIRVVRVRRIVEERSVRVPFRVVTQHDPEMESGVRKVVQQGSEGLKVQRYAVVLEDGTRVSTRLLDETRRPRTARDHIVRVGTKEPTFKGGGGSQSGHRVVVRGRRSRRRAPLAADRVGREGDRRRHRASR